jgi:hypothetical protein
MKIKKMMYSIVAFVMLFTVFSPARADQMVNTYQAYVVNPTGYATSIWVVGDLLSWSVTYDNANLTSQRYNDGLNGIAESGNGDDTILDTISGGLWTSDAVFTFDAKMTSYFATSEDDTSINFSYYQELSISGSIGLQYMRDGATLQMDSTSGIFRAGRFNNRGRVTFNETVLTSTAPLNPVPEPTTIILFSAGLAGVAGVARWKKQTDI